MPADHGPGSDDKAAGLQSIQTADSQARSHRSADVSFGSFDGPLQNAEVMAKSQDFELKRRPAPKGSENSGKERTINVPTGIEV